MFKLLIALFLVTEGIPAEQPMHIMTFNHSAFETEDSCMEFIGTDEGRVATAALAISARIRASTPRRLMALIGKPKMVTTESGWRANGTTFHRKRCSPSPTRTAARWFGRCTTTAK